MRNATRLGTTAGLEPASPLPYSPIVQAGFRRKVGTLSIELRRDAMQRQKSESQPSSGAIFFGRSPS
jgi:hypothetical protein